MSILINLKDKQRIIVEPLNKSGKNNQGLIIIQYKQNKIEKKNKLFGEEFQEILDNYTSKLKDDMTLDR